MCARGFPNRKESACNAGDLGSIPGLGRTPGGGNGNPLQYAVLENSMDRGAWRAAVHVVSKSQTRLSTMTAMRVPTQHTHTLWNLPPRLQHRPGETGVSAHLCDVGIVPESVPASSSSLLACPRCPPQSSPAPSADRSRGLRLSDGKCFHDLPVQRGSGTSKFSLSEAKCFCFNHLSLFTVCLFSLLICSPPSMARNLHKS